ncbi:ATP-dependent exoDNAse (exonuclease V) beta subunit (contains helicase and exonuclease domains) [Pustulibacterium marinum]|uniref:DNA 3'-5' helicase n=1 Tax=Pustulibacterium marinum TaxID=1224947 RepID=A0A1I7ESU1_9FLAO|nr:UvrD-helicase domain-containing protein [Pustulibacterium marinum]SFU26970.1 ATP-dependent exoDNAse (exonuclease V) beta subunit (contains helicase and exonuclease domains) [Pustulibacterium marinum]
MKEATFKIYNASAGSGKTFTLVKEYLKILLSGNYADGFKQILAITFTNKAVGEMKERIVENLSDFANNPLVAEENDMFKSLMADLNIDAVTLQTRSRKVLKKILHNYAFFDVSTIDKFNHRLIRTFALDLKLPQNFEVALETDLLLKEAVDNLIANAGNDKKLTKVLIDFVLEKVDDDKSWDISNDIFEASKKIINENHYKPLSKLKHKTVDDFLVLKKSIKSKIDLSEKLIKSEAQKVLDTIQNEGLEFTDFSRKTLPNHFEKHLSGSHYGNPYKNKLEENIANGSGIYPAKLAEDKKASIDSLLPAIEEAFQIIKKNYFHLSFLKNIYKNLVPLTVINSVQKELQHIKDDENLVLISEFNATISETIKDQPAPFIYERLGEKYRFYFIDEFQDTSEMQWNNLVPLIDSALAGESLSEQKGSLFLVGDAKQAIYRWRGGNPEQFINLFTKTNNPFQISAENNNLGTNYRSYDAIINFNNAFFNFAKSYLTSETHQELYELSFQESNRKKGGYVGIEFIESNDEQHDNEIYVERTLNTIQQTIEKGYTYKDIAVLTRKNSQGVMVANALAEANIPIVSSETLLLKNSGKIQFLNNLVRYSIYPESQEIKAKLLLYLAFQQKQETTHTFIKNRIELTSETAFQDYSFSLYAFLQKPFYDAIQYAIQQFELADESDAYLQYYLDILLEFNEKYKEGATAFINYWDEKGDRLSLVAPDGMDAVSLYTVHKSKGLEFPVVIYPFVQDEIIESRSQTWVHVDAEEFSGFDNLFINANKDFAEISEEANTLKEIIDTRSALDNMNVLYVALTRAVKQLHIISHSKAKENSYAKLLQDFVAKEKGEVQNYNPIWGENSYLAEKTKEASIINDTIPFRGGNAKKTLNIVTKNGMLWDTKQQNAIEKGNIIHQLLANIKTEKDIEFSIEKALVEGVIAENETNDIKTTLQTLIHHPDLSSYFTDETYSIFNEREIVTNTGALLRPDRLMLGNNEAIIIDYKTGSMSSRYQTQLDSYENALKNMGFINIKKILVFIYPEISVKYF